MPEKVVGILGGMGPEATANFLAKVIALTPAQRDQDHLRIIIDNNPKIPDRTEAILTKDKSLFPILVETAKNLEKADADFIVIPCNTVHYFYEDLVTEISVPILHMMSEVVHAVSASLPGCKRLGLIATTGTVASNLYQKQFRKLEVEVIVPDPQYQAKIMDAILRIKASHVRGRARREIIKAANLLIEREAQALVLGCTDIPLVVKVSDFPVPVFDSTEILAKATVKFARSDTMSS
jgi:aspartate racemase